MSRLAPLDKALVLILVPIWVACFALGVRTLVRGGRDLVGTVSGNRKPGGLARARAALPIPIGATTSAALDGNPPAEVVPLRGA